MKNYLFLSVFCILVFSCGDDDTASGTPDCIQEKIDEYAANESLAPIAVYKTTIGDEEHFWFNTEAVHVDGAEFILNAQCDTICGYCGECIPADCISEYPAYGDDEWEFVWEKE